MRLLLIGAPGAGKGTQAELLAERLGITHISSGDLLRQHVRDETALGQTIRSYVDHGDLVPDGVVMDMLRKPVVAASETGGYVLDGFPRTVDQAKAAFAVAEPLGAAVQAAVHLDVPSAELVRRLLSRGRGSDDTQAVIEHRLQVYEENTVPLLEYYAGREWMFTVDGAQPAEVVHSDISGGCGGWPPSPQRPGDVSPGTPRGTRLNVVPLAGVLVRADRGGATPYSGPRLPVVRRAGQARWSACSWRTIFRASVTCWLMFVIELNTCRTTPWRSIT